MYRIVQQYLCHTQRPADWGAGWRAPSRISLHVACSLTELLSLTKRVATLLRFVDDYLCSPGSMMAIAERGRHGMPACEKGLASKLEARGSILSRTVPAPLLQSLAQESRGGVAKLFVIL